jgi:hypothetical protein
MPDTQRDIQGGKVNLLEQMVGMNLDGFTVQKCTEVYKIDDDGTKTKSVGYFKDKEVAEAYAQNKVHAAWHKTKPVYLLTDGKIGVLMGERVALIDDEATIVVEVRDAILAKLTPAERKILGV